MSSGAAACPARGDEGAAPGDPGEARHRIVTQPSPAGHYRFGTA